MSGKDPLQPVLECCVGLARADTHTGALDWFDTPIIELSDWVETINRLEKSNKKSKRK